MLEVKGLNKKYGTNAVVKGVSFNVHQGEAFGLLGPNGAGKSTLISMICGLVSPDEGEILLKEHSVRERLMWSKRQIGLVPQEIALYPEMSAIDNLLFWGRMYGLSAKEGRKRAEEVLSFVGLESRGKDRIETFSGGMKRRINIGAALMHHPALLIMDEPTVGIDPQSRNHILDAVRDLKEHGTTIIYTSHYMEEVEHLCDRVGIIDYGEVIASGTTRDLCRRLMGGAMIQLRMDNVTKKQLAEFEDFPLIEKVIQINDGQIYDVFVDSPDEAMSDVIAEASRLGMKVSSVEVKEPNLERLFLQLTGRSLRD